MLSDILYSYKLNFTHLILIYHLQMVSLEHFSRSLKMFLESRLLIAPKARVLVHDGMTNCK